MTTSSDIESSVSFFSIGEDTYSVLNATSIPVNSSQTAVFTVPDWDNLNSTQSAANLQIYETGNSNPVVNINLANPVIPEYPSTTMLFLFTITTLLMAIAYRRKRPVDFSTR